MSLAELRRNECDMNTGTENGLNIPVSTIEPRLNPDTSLVTSASGSSATSMFPFLSSFLSALVSFPPGTSVSASVQPEREGWQGA